MGHQGRAEVHIANARCTSILVFVLSAAALMCGRTSVRAQLVADGATNTIDGYSTNLIGDLIVGTNGSFTLLRILDGGTVTSSRHGYVGQNFTSSSNNVEVAGLNSSWQMAGNLSIGYSIGGPYNQLAVRDGALVSCSNANIGGYNKGNSILVLGGSLVAAFEVALGNSGASASNTLVIRKGGQVTDSTGRIGNSSSTYGSHQPPLLACPMLKTDRLYETSA